MVIIYSHILFRIFLILWWTTRNVFCSSSNLDQESSRKVATAGSCGGPWVKLSEGSDWLGRWGGRSGSTTGRKSGAAPPDYPSGAPGFGVGRYIQGLFMHARPHLATNITSEAAASDTREELFILHLICVMRPRKTKRPFWETLWWDVSHIPPLCNCYWTVHFLIVLVY